MTSLLTPHEILKQLGFNIPEEGISVNPHDAYLNSQMLNLLGQCMRVDAIPAEELSLFCQTITGMGAVMHSGRADAEAPPITEVQTNQFKTMLNCILKAQYGFGSESAPDSEQK
jgi:hypothetical protein